MERKSIKTSGGRTTPGVSHACDPLELLERRAVLTPRPRVNLILYDGVLAPRAAWRAALVRATSPGVDTSALEPSVEPNKDASPVKPSRAGAYQSGRVDAANVWA
jgi:hypothetical protein